MKKTDRAVAQVMEVQCGVGRGSLQHIAPRTPVEIIFNMTRNGVLGKKKDYIFFGRFAAEWPTGHWTEPVLIVGCCPIAQWQAER